MGAGDLVEVAEGMDEVPPTPVAREMDVRMPWEREVGNESGVKGEKELRKEMSVALDQVSQKWALSNNHSRFESEISSSSESDDGQSLISDLINTTTDAIRRVQRYCVALPADKFTTLTPSYDSVDRNSASKESDFVRAASIMRGLSTTTTNSTENSKSAPRSSPSSSPSTPSSAPLNSTSLSTEVDPLLSLRKSPIDVLTMLKSLETKYRLYTSSPISSTPLSPTTNSQLDIYEEEDAISAEEETESIADVNYRTDVVLEDLLDETEVVRGYIELVERVLFPAHSTRRKSKKSLLVVRSQSIATVVEESPTIAETRQWKKEEGEGEMKKKGSPLGHRRSAKIDSGMLEEFVAGEEIRVALGLGHSPTRGDEEDDEEEEELPDWATDDKMDLFHRAHVIFLDHLPPQLSSQLVDPSNRTQFLDSLSNGTLLCKSYNAVLRSSNRPFGFIPPASIHELDIGPSVLRGVVPSSRDADGGGTEKKERIGMTFRRSENLRIWAGALKHRYQISLSPKSSKSSIGFDEKIIATKGELWEEMLENALKGWVEAVVLECLSGRE